MFKEHERVVLLSAITAEGLEPGDVGTIVHVYRNGQAYEVEFVSLDGHTRVLQRCLEAGLTPDDPLTILASVGALPAPAFAAGFIPATRASRIDPIVALSD
ncbi:MAG: DUF4926 domain-containing protein, partial [Acidobacteria bacterium]|nr:DUF4926 domain-containing protein [Acidobacteriota bacterium]